MPNRILTVRKIDQKTGCQAEIGILMYFGTYCIWTSQLSCRSSEPIEYVKVSIIILCVSHNQFASNKLSSIKPIPKYHLFKVFHSVLLSIFILIPQMMQSTTVHSVAKVHVNLPDVAWHFARWFITMEEISNIEQITVYSSVKRKENMFFLFKRILLLLKMDTK